MQLVTRPSGYSPFFPSSGNAQMTSVLRKLFEGTAGFMLQRARSALRSLARPSAHRHLHEPVTCRPQLTDKKTREMVHLFL